MFKKGIVEENGLRFLKHKTKNKNGGVVMNKYPIIPKEIEAEFAIAKLTGYCTREVFDKIEKYLDFEDIILESQLDGELDGTQP